PRMSAPVARSLLVGLALVFAFTGAVRGAPLVVGSELDLVGSSIGAFAPAVDSSPTGYVVSWTWSVGYDPPAVGARRLATDGTHVGAIGSFRPESPPYQLTPHPAGRPGARL